MYIHTYEDYQCACVCMWLCAPPVLVTTGPLVTPMGRGEGVTPVLLLLCSGVTALPTLGGSWMALIWGEWLAAIAGDVVGKGLRLGMGEGVRVSRKTEPAQMTRSDSKGNSM